MALVLWGLDNIKTQGEGVAQALWLLGTRPVRDALNRTTSVEAIPLDELGRPRIDVVMTVSGIFRDLFSPTVQLLDKAVRLVAQLDEPLELNYVRKHVLQQVEQDRCDLDDAAMRVFSNAPGNYGTNVNFMVMDSQWDREETLGISSLRASVLPTGAIPPGADLREEKRASRWTVRSRVSRRPTRTSTPSRSV
jgi:magnesium chelatase subunit H